MASCASKASCVLWNQTRLTRNCPLPPIRSLLSRNTNSASCTAQGHTRSVACSANYQTTAQAPVVPSEFTGPLREAYLAGHKSGYAAGVQVRVDVRLDSGKNLRAVEYSGGIQQDSLLRSLLKGVVWRVFSTALTVSIILAVFRDTVQVEQALQIGGLEFVLKLFVYFAHERLWVQIGDSIN